MNAVPGQLRDSLLVDIFRQSMKILDVRPEGQIDLAIVPLNVISEEAEIPDQPGIFILVHGFVVFHVQLSLFKEPLWNAEQIADFGNDQIGAVGIVDFFLRFFFVVFRKSIDGVDVVCNWCHRDYLRFCCVLWLSAATQKKHPGYNSRVFAVFGASAF